jgi:hypothetical protein
MSNIPFVEVTTVADAYKIDDGYYVSGRFEGQPVTVLAVRDSDHHSATTFQIIEMIDAAIAAGELDEATMAARGAVVAEQQRAEEAKRQADYEASLTYADRRKAAYAPMAQQLDMQYWDDINGTTTWRDHIAEVKARFPKPDPE